MSDRDLDRYGNRAAYRAFVREHHPDRGGDVDTFIAGMAELRAARATTDDPIRAPGGYDAPVVFVTRRRGLRAIPIRLRRWRDRRNRLPRVR